MFQLVLLVQLPHVKMIIAISYLTLPTELPETDIPLWLGSTVTILVKLGLLSGISVQIMTTYQEIQLYGGSVPVVYIHVIQVLTTQMEIFISLLTMPILKTLGIT
jgi:hypothetical protein